MITKTYPIKIIAPSLSRTRYGNGAPTKNYHTHLNIVGAASSRDSLSSFPLEGRLQATVLSERKNWSLMADY
jgi:hypothetical protein